MKSNWKKLSDIQKVGLVLAGIICLLALLILAFYLGGLN